MHFYPKYNHKIFLIFYFQTTLDFEIKIFHKWLENFDIKQFYDLISLHKNLKFIFENPSRTLNFQEICW